MSTSGKKKGAEHRRGGGGGMLEVNDSYSKSDAEIVLVKSGKHVQQCSTNGIPQS